MSHAVLLPNEERVFSEHLAEHRRHSEVGVFSWIRRTIWLLLPYKHAIVQVS